MVIEHIENAKLNDEISYAPEVMEDKISKNKEILDYIKSTFAIYGKS